MLNQQLKRDEFKTVNIIPGCKPPATSGIYFGVLTLAIFLVVVLVVFLPGVEALRFGICKSS